MGNNLTDIILIDLKTKPACNYVNMVLDVHDVLLQVHAEGTFQPDLLHQSFVESVKIYFENFSLLFF